jgi:hypothetical protein
MMSLEVKFYLVAMVVAGVLACIPPGSLVLVATSALFGGLALMTNYMDKGGHV